MELDNSKLKTPDNRANDPKTVKSSQKKSRKKPYRDASEKADIRQAVEQPSKDFSINLTQSRFKNSKKFVSGNHPNGPANDFIVTDRVFRSLLTNQVKDQYEEVVGK